LSERRQAKKLAREDSNNYPIAKSEKLKPHKKEFAAKIKAYL